MLRLRLLLLLPLLALTIAACSGSRAESGGPPPDLVLRVSQTGLYEVTAQDLKSRGWSLDPAQLEGKRIALLQGDQDIPYQLTGRGKERALRFFAQVTPTRFDDRAAFILRLVDDGGDAPALGVLTSAGATEAPATSFMSTVRAEANATYLAQVRDGDPWLGQRIFAPSEITVAIDTPAPVDGGGTLRVKVWAATTAPGDIDHHLVFILNGRELGEDAWDGNGPLELELTIPAGTLQDGGNELVIRAPGDTGAAADLVYLDWIEATYQRATVAVDDRLLFETDASAVAASGFKDGDIAVWEVSDPERPLQVAIGRLENGRVEFSVPGSKPHTFIAFSKKGVRKPNAIEPASSPLTAPEEGADYIVIAHPSLAGAIQPLVDYRRQQGLRVAVVTTDQIYQRFNAGMQSPDAITDFLRWAVETWPQPAPRFVLLAGDASYDPLDYLKAPYKNLIPGKFVPTIEMGETISDNAMADINGDGWQDLAIGRFPAQTPDQIQAMVAKTIAFETARPEGDWIDQMLFVADDDDPYFSKFNEDHIAMIPDAFTTENLVIVPDQDTRGQLLTRLNQGRGLVSYMGHGAIDIWAQEEIFKNADVPELDQQGRLGVYLVWACLNGYFQHPSQLSLGEVLLITPDKGAVAGLFPTGQTFPNDQWIMADALFQKVLFTQPTIGAAFMEAAHALKPEFDGQRDIINTFLLLGDPALQLPWGEGQ